MGANQCTRALRSTIATIVPLGSLFDYCMIAQLQLYVHTLIAHDIIKFVVQCAMCNLLQPIADRNNSSSPSYLLILILILIIMRVPTL